MTRLFIAGLALALIGITPAAGQVVEGDDAQFGPGSITIDRSQGLAFLDFTHTLGMTPTDLGPLSGPGGQFEGWRLGTEAELTRLVNNWGFSPELTEYANAFGNTGDDQVSGLVDLLGVTETNGFTRSAFAINDPVGGRGYLGRAIRDNEPGSDDSVELINAGYSGTPTIGLFLVRDAVVVTYQGRLTTAGQLLTGVYDLQTQLFDGAGQPVSDVRVVAGVEVQDGLFDMVLPFDVESYGSSKLFLEIGVRDASSGGAFETLAPRQTVSSAPRALFAGRALKADNATSAISAESASNATNAQQADNAATAGHALTADLATSALSADTAEFAESATSATDSQTLGGRRIIAGVIKSDGTIISGTGFSVLNVQVKSTAIGDSYDGYVWLVGYHQPFSGRPSVQVTPTDGPYSFWYEADLGGFNSPGPLDGVRIVVRITPEVVGGYPQAVSFMVIGPE